MFPETGSAYSSIFDLQVKEEFLLQDYEFKTRTA